MENHEEIVVKPSFKVSVMLFFLMTVLVASLIHSFMNIPDFQTDIISGIAGMTYVVSFLADIFIYSYGLSGIYRTLQRKTYGISMVKLTLLYLILQSVFSTIEKLGRGIPFLYVIEIPILLYCIIMYVYLSKSKQLDNYIPKKCRKFTIHGWEGLILLFFPLSVMIYEFYNSYFRLYQSLPIPEQSVKLMSGEVTDGISVYSIPSSWQTDSTHFFESAAMKVYHTTDSLEYKVASVVYKFTSRLDCNVLMTSLLDKESGCSTPIMHEIYNHESEINGNRMFANGYYVDDGDSHGKWVSIALVSDRFYKILIVSGYTEDEGKFMESGISLMRTVDFDLKKRAVME